MFSPCSCLNVKDPISQPYSPINIKLELFFSPSSHSIVVFSFPVGLSSLSRDFQQVLLGVAVSSVSETEETSTPNKTCCEYRVNDERPTGKENTTIEPGDGGKINNF